MASTDNSQDYPILIRPLPITRRANAAAGVLLAVIGFVLLCGGLLTIGGIGVGSTLLMIMSGVVAISGGIVLAVRGAHMSLILDVKDAHIRGLIRTVQIPRSQVREITPFPSIKWTDASGRSHTSPVNALNLRKSKVHLQTVLSNAEWGTRTLRAWALGESLARRHS